VTFSVLCDQARSTRPVHGVPVNTGVKNRWTLKNSHADELLIRHVCARPKLESRQRKELCKKVLGGKTNPCLHAGFACVSCLFAAKARWVGPVIGRADYVANQ